jgi:small subunit ribosomal protein S29
MIAPSLLSTRKSPAMTRFLGNEKSTSSSAYTPVGTSFDTYGEILSGLKQLAVPPRLKRKEAVGVVRMLQGWRGIRDSECFAFAVLA